MFSFILTVNPGEEVETKNHKSEHCIVDNNASFKALRLRCSSDIVMYTHRVSASLCETRHDCDARCTHTADAFVSGANKLTRLGAGSAT